MKQIPTFLLLILLLGVAACRNTAETGSASEQSAPTIPIAGTVLSITETAPIPDSFPSQIRNNFDRYTQVIAPNGKPIIIYAQANLTDAQITQARNTLIFWLTDVPGSQFGADKTAVANKMGDNQATLLLLNGADGEGNPPNVNGQHLYQNELVVPGSAWYIDNNFEHRDATFEEILHLVHDTGIGVDGPNSSPGALPDFQTEIRAATNNAIDNNFQFWPIDARSDKQWYNELSAENSLSQEYLAAVIDSYYGLWGPFPEEGGMWGVYIAKTREDIEAKDPMGWALMDKYFSPYLTYNAQLDPSFDGTFTMTFDPATPYTHKSQYMLHATLTGSNHANLTGNDQDNELGGNSGDNVLDGMGGNNTAVYPRVASEYTITNNEDGTITVVGDGTDTLINIQNIRFADETVSVQEAGNATTSMDESSTP
ncbi:MAG: hypothetical protein CSA11_01735 [Chloroflexi bacterium]|nr:MAG: hypothetical protein CSA11_01735 [Chloroflexota bacterium]